MSHLKKLTAVQMQILDGQQRIMQMVNAAGAAGIGKSALKRSLGIGDYFCGKRLRELAEEGKIGPVRSGGHPSVVTWVAIEHHAAVVAERQRREALRMERAAHLKRKAIERDERAAYEAQQEAEAEAWAADRGITRLAAGQYGPIFMPGQRVVASVFHLGA